MKPTLLGKVRNNYSNFLSLLAIDAGHADAYEGAAKSGKDDDFERANSQAAKGKFEFAVGSGSGIICEVGGCGSTDIYWVDDSTLVFVEHYSDDWDDAIEADFLVNLVGIPTAKKCKRLGSVEIASGVMALVSLVEGVKVAPKQIAAVAKSKKASSYEWGLLVPMHKGTYEIWREDLGDIHGEWGSISSRVRIVPKGTLVVAGQSITAPESKMKAKPKKSPTVARVRLFAEGWGAVESFAALPDGSRIVAGEQGGLGICCWDEKGTVIWQRRQPKPKSDADYYKQIAVRLLPNGRLLAISPDKEGLHEIDLQTGKLVRDHAGIAPDRPGNRALLRAFAVSPDGRRLILRISTETLVCAFPSMKVVAELGEYCNMDNIAISPDSRWLGVNGHQVHVYELDTGKHQVTFEPPKSPWSSAFSPDSKTLALGSEDGLVRFYAVGSWKLGKTLDVAPERSRKGTVSALAYRPNGQLATASEDGAVKVWDPRSLDLLRVFDKHDTSIPGTGARRISEIDFIQGGDALVVSAGLKKEPCGLSVYRL